MMIADPEPRTGRRPAPRTGRLDLAIDIAQPCAGWRRALGDAAGLCESAARAALAARRPRLAGAIELSLVLGDDRLVRRLNRRWRGQDKPTNVLAFASDEGVRPTAAPAGVPRILGDVVLGFETVAGEAAAQGKPLADHLSHLVIHGVLHLLGYDHQRAREARRMEARETAILAGLGIPDPYADPCCGATDG
jgi:probable rRNA maturation factor